MKKFISILTMLIVAFVAVLCLSVNTFADDASDNNKITMNVKKNSDGIKLVGNNGHVYAETDTIYITFTGSADMEGTATIYYATQDATAIAKAKDYESASGSLTLNKENYTQTVAIKVTHNNFGVQSQTHDGVSTRYFKFIVTDVIYPEGTFYNAINDSTDKTVLCDINYNSYYQTKTYNGNVIFSEYDKLLRESEYLCAGPGEVDTTKTYFTNNQTAFTWNTDYVNRGLADIYGGMEFTTTKEAWEIIFGADTRYYLSSNKKGDIQKINIDDSHFSYDYTFADQIGSKDHFEISDYGNHVEQLGKYFRGIKLTDSKQTNNDSSAYSIYARCDNNDTGAGFQVYGQMYLNERLIDTEAPHATKVYGLSNNLSRLDGKIRVAVRFNEPVMVKNPDKLYAKIQFDIYDSGYFKYVEGSETDTLVFETDLNSVPSNMYSDIKLLGLYSSDGGSEKSTAIVDYSIHSNVVSTDNVVTGSADYDFSNPEILDVLTSQSDVALKQRPYSVEVKNVDNGAIYYMFSTSSDLLTYDPKTTTLSTFLKNYYSDSIPVTKEKTVYTIMATDKDGNYLSGQYYLHTFLLSGNGKSVTRVDGKNGCIDKTHTSAITPYGFDSDSPTIESYTVTGSVKTKTVALNIEDKNYSTGIKSIVVDGYKKDSYGRTTKTIFEETNKASASSTYNDSFEIKISEIDIDDGDYGYYDFLVTITDMAGNTTTLQLENLLFDTRNIFEVEESVDKIDYTTKYQEKVISGTAREISYEITTPTYKDNGYSLYIKSLKYGELTYEAMYDPNGLVVDQGTTTVLPDAFHDYISILQQPGSISLYPSKSGRIEVVFGLLNPSDVVDPEDSSKIISKKDSYVSGIESMHFVYYCTEGYQDDVVNYNTISNPEYVKNYLFALENAKYYYLSSNGEKQSANYTSVGYPVFSTSAKAKDFIKYYELQDLYLLYLDGSASSEYIINCLNNRDYSSSYAKSTTEVKTAAPNQFWIRYKETTWTTTASANNGWVYYYLCDDTGIANPSNNSVVINPSNLPQALSNAIDTITNNIVKQGKYQYFCGEDYVDGVGRPNIRKEQIIFEDKNDVTKSMSGSKFTSALYLEKDSKIYDSFYTISETTDAPLLMYYRPDLTTDPTTRFFYCKQGTNDYVEITNIGSNTLDSFFPEGQQCLYWIIELGVNGAKKYQVYVDREAPTLNIKYVSSGSETSAPLSKNGELSVKNIKFISIEDGDKYAYVTITKNSGAFTPITCLVSEIGTKAINLTDGSYTLYVSDRYGNSFKFTLNICRTEIEMTSEDAIKRGNSCVFAEITNRKLSEISSYVVYLDDNIYSTTPTLEARFTESGTYKFVVRDIYGYTAERTVEFKRSLPNVQWAYSKNGVYTRYEYDSNPPLTITSTGTQGSANVFLVMTAVELICIFPREYTFSFSGTAPNHFNVSEDGSTRVVIKSLTNWTLNIFYDGDDSTKVTYVCMVDNEAPDIQVTYDVKSYKISDYDDLDVEAAKQTEAGIVIEGTSAVFVEIPEKSHKAIVDEASTVYSSKFSLLIKDDNTIKSVTVTLDGEPYTGFTLDDVKAGAVELSGYGDFVITATDIFGNSSTFTFNNSSLSMVERKVDGNVKESEELINGNSADTFLVAANGIIVYQITIDGVSKMYMFRITDNGLFRTEYVTFLDNTTMRWAYKDVETIIALNSTVDMKNVEINLPSTNISVTLTDKGYLFKVKATEKAMSIVYSYKADDFSECHVYSSKISKELTDVVLKNKTEETNVTTNQNGNLILIHDELELVYPVSSDIVSIKFGYSETNIAVADYELTEIDLANNKQIDTALDGFYVIQVLNIYGNLLTYRLSKFVDINVETKVEYVSGGKNYYSVNYTDTIYTNKLATVTLYANVMYSAFKVEKLVNGVYTEYPVTVSSEVNTYYVTLTEEGSYKVVVIDDYGNTSTKYIDILSGVLSYDDSLITGFNNTALEKYYTNQILSINKNALDSLGIVYVRIGKNVIYDIISESDQINDEALLINAIGDGESRCTYDVCFRDKYGNECIKSIYYSAYSTLKVERNYKNSSTFESVDYTTDVYSNNTIRIYSDDDSKSSKILVDGNSNSSTLEFSYGVDGNYVTHTVRYQDVYGFVYEFKINIVREDISINVNSDNEEKTIDGILTVKGGFTISYNNNSTCVFTHSDGQTGVYDGQTLSKAGIYLFTVTDKAGNQNSLRVKLDNVCEYEFVDNLGLTMYPGKVTDSGVRFRTVNGDQTMIYRVTRDGKEIEFSGDSFTKHGLYYVVVTDEIGNEAEFYFQIITHKVSEFSYTAPTGYTIVDMYVEHNDEYKDHYADFEPTKFSVTENGRYTVVLKNDTTGVTDNFIFVVDNTAPAITTNVDPEKGSTKADVVISGLERGDVVQIYKGSKLYNTVEVTSESSITISEAGTYTVVVTNEAGLSTTVEFKKDFVMNTAGSVLIIISCVAVSTMLLAGLMLRKRSKVDK